MKKWLYLTLMSLVVFTFTACKDDTVSFNITFDSNGGSLVENIVYDGVNEVKFPDHPTKEGYVFDGWYLDNETYLNPFDINPYLDELIKSDITLYAKWLAQDSLLTTQLQNIYLLALGASLFQGTYEEWLETIRGEQGLPGANGKDGETPFIGENGNWWIGNLDLGISTGHITDNIEDFSEGLVFSLTTYNGENAHVVTGYYGNDKNVIIPGYFNGLKVVGVAGFAFLHAWQSNIFLIESVFIPKEVEFIGVYAFGDQPDLTTVVFEENSSLKIIDANAFNYTSMSQVKLPESLIYIGQSAFGSSPLISVIIEGEVQRFNEVWNSIGFPEELKP